MDHEAIEIDELNKPPRHDSCMSSEGSTPQNADQNHRDSSCRAKEKESKRGGSGGGGDEGEEGDQPSVSRSDSEEDTAAVLYEAELEPILLENSTATNYSLHFMSVIIVIITGVLFISSFPFSLIVSLFCMDTERAFCPFRYILRNPWRLYLTQDTICYHLPKPPRRPYINFFYCKKQPYYKFEIRFSDIADIVVEEAGYAEDGTLTRSNKLLADGLKEVHQNIVIQLKASVPPIAVPSHRRLALIPKYQSSRQLVILSVKDADVFVEKVKAQITKNK